MKRVQIDKFILNGKQVFTLEQIPTDVSELTDSSNLLNVNKVSYGEAQNLTTAQKEQARKNIGSLISAPTTTTDNERVYSTLTENQLSAIVGGVAVSGVFLGEENPIFYPARYASGVYNGFFIGTDRIFSYTIENNEIEKGDIEISFRNGLSINASVLSILGKAFPAFPNDTTKTYVLKQEETTGNLVWGEIDLTIDDEMSSSSENFVQNKVIKEYVDEAAYRKQNKDLVFQNIQAGQWVEDNEYPEFPYKALVTLQGVDETMVPSVTFSVADSLSGKYSPVAESCNQGIYIWSNDNTTSPIIPCIVMSSTISAVYSVEAGENGGEVLRILYTPERLVPTIGTEGDTLTV